MAHVLSLTDGTTTVTLTSGDYTLLDYTPLAVDPSEALTAVISEDIAVLVSDSTTPNVQSNINAIEKLLTYATNRQQFGTGPKVYVKYQLSGDSDTYRSEVVGGYVDITPDAIKAWVGAKAEIVVRIRRRGFWEDDTETVLVNGTTLTNEGSVNSTTISGASIEGVLPAPAKVKIENTHANGIFWDTFHLGLNAWNDPTNFKGNFNGLGVAQTWSAGANDSSLEDWTLTTANLADMAGDYFRMILCLEGQIDADAYLRGQVKFGTTILAKTGKVYTGVAVTKQVYDLGALPLPPGGYLTSNAPLTLELVVSADAASTYGSDVDFIQLFPAGPGRYRRLEQIGYDVDLGDTLVDDPYEGLVYVEDASDSDNRIPIVTKRGEPLLLWPGKTCRVLALFDESDADPYNPARTFKLYVSYRPRRASV